MSKSIIQINPIDMKGLTVNFTESYIDICDNYFENIAAVYHIENDIFESLVKNGFQYFDSTVSFYKNLILMYFTICRSCNSHSYHYSGISQ